jgi:hypothetical protein
MMKGTDVELFKPYDKMARTINIQIREPMCQEEVNEHLKLFDIRYTEYS